MSRRKYLQPRIGKTFLDRTLEKKKSQKKKVSAKLKAFVL